MWLWGLILVLVMAVVETTVVGVELTAMALAVLGMRLGQTELVWLAVWGGVVLGRGVATIVALWGVTVVGLAYRRFGGEPRRWWAGLVVAAGGSGILRWLAGNWSVGGMVVDVIVWGVMWAAVSWWQDRWSDREISWQ